LSELGTAAARHRVECGVCRGRSPTWRPATRALHGAAPEEERDGAAAASFDGEGGERWTAAEELWLSKGDGCDARLGSRRRPPVGARAAASLAE
jgi:hypothetical protein